jgi:formylglycine-generating enzyme required for sulfatase activity
LKSFVGGLFVCFLLCGCAQAQKNSANDSKVQQLIDRTLKDMVFVESGSYMMGDPGDKLMQAFGDQAFKYYLPCQDNKPVHKVTLDSYYMGKFEITFEQHDIFTATTGREPTCKRDIGREVRAPANPAGTSWHSAKEYCEWLGEQTGLPFDLPTEAQWEYAARSQGKLVPFATDTGFVDRGRNYPPPSMYDPLPIGQYPPNPLGLHDMSGNAYEWVLDWYDPEYYSRSPEKNPRGPKTGIKKVVRGGGVDNSPGGSSTVMRAPGGFHHKSYPGMGFRCVVNTGKLLPVSDQL